MRVQPHLPISPLTAMDILVPSGEKSGTTLRRRHHLAGDRDNQRKDHRGNHCHTDIDFDKFLHRPQERPERRMAWPDDKLAAGDVDRETAYRQVELSSTQPWEFRIEITVRKQHGAVQERVAELSDAAFESKSRRGILHITVRLLAGYRQGRWRATTFLSGPVAVQWK